MREALVVLASILVVVALAPVMTSLYQFLLVGLSAFSSHLQLAKPFVPRVAVLIPAWNEGAVIGGTLDRLMKLDYPADSLRAYVIDDASTDETPSVTRAKAKEYYGRVFHIRRVAGGEGKAHTLNYGLKELWRSEWAEAVLIMDADVRYTATSLTQMARHLADPQVGAVTAYIKEGSASPNSIQRFITFEYITATGASRRAQNVLGFLACLSGGAQLHSRANLLAIGGQIFSDTLAEDTFTTFNTQLTGRKAIFEPNAIVYAEEPDTLDMLWKQRLRWARGNVQITQVFRKIWLNKEAHTGLGSLSMSLIWFSLFLMPLLQIGATVGLLMLYGIDEPTSWKLFRLFWIASAVVYFLVTSVSLAIDGESARKSWLEGILFPGWISIALIAYAVANPVRPLEPPFAFLNDTWRGVVLVFIYSWLSLSMVVAWLALQCARSNRLQWLAMPLLYTSGYGSFLCAITFGSYIKELTGASRTWDKTVKTGKVA